MIMNWTIFYLSNKNIIHIETKGKATVEDLNELVKQAKQTSLQYNSNRFLVDHRKTIVNLQFFEIYDRPQVLDTLNSHRKLKIAPVFPKSQRESFRFSETVSQNILKSA